MITSKHNILIRSASYLSFTVAIVILLIKIYGWVITDSQSLLASLVDSLLDISSSFINLIAIRFALQPPDHQHRFGHEKIQDLAIFSQSIFFFASALFTFSSSLKCLWEEAIPNNITQGSNLMCICIILTIILVIYQQYVISKTNSQIIRADKLHYSTDLFTNILVIISINLSDSFWFIDPLGGIFIALYIFYSSYSLFKKAVRNLIDEELPEKDRQDIISIIIKYKKIKGIHDMKTRYAANKLFIQCHLEMDANMSLLEAHELSEEITKSLMTAFPDSEVIIHQDPYGIEEQVDYREL